MKPNFPLRFLFALSLSVLFMSCSTDDDSNNSGNNAQLIAQISVNMSSGSWRISSFIDSGQDETNDFNNYDFTFGAGGTLTATNGTDTLMGTWSITDDSSSDDSSDDDVDFNIFFPVPDTNPFEDLNDDWDVVSYTSTSIQLRDVSGGNGDIDTLTFVKN